MIAFSAENWLGSPVFRGKLAVAEFIVGRRPWHLVTQLAAPVASLWQSDVSAIRPTLGDW